MPKIGSEPKLIAVLIPLPALQTVHARVDVCPPLRETTPTCPGTHAIFANSSGAPNMPREPLPGETSPAEPGPSNLTPFFFAILIISSASCNGSRSTSTNIVFMPASSVSSTAALAISPGTKTTVASASPSLSIASFTVL